VGTMFAVKDKGVKLSRVKDKKFGHRYWVSWNDNSLLLDVWISYKLSFIVLSQFVTQQFIVFQKSCLTCYFSQASKS
jgi:hypothetical protein